MDVATARVLFLLSLASVGSCSQYVAFDLADANSVYSAGASNGVPVFAPTQATSSGTGYWCSAGGHKQDEVVTWTGVLGAKVQASAGIRLTFAYSPDAVKVLVSPDGMNFVEAAGWQASTRSDVSFTHFIPFARPTSVQAVTVMLRGPRSWGFFGISNAALLADPGPSMLISGSTSAQSGCVVREENDQVFLAPCLDAISTGLGKEIFMAQESGGTGMTFESATSPGNCLSSENPIGGGSLVVKPCDSIGASGTFTLTESSQLKLAGLGNYCVIANGAVLSTLDCEEAAQSSNAGDKFFLMAASEVDTNIGSAANDVASLAAATADRLSASNVALSSALQSCSLISGSLSQIKANVSSGKSDYAELIAETRKIIAMARRS